VQENRLSFSEKKKAHGLGGAPGTAGEVMKLCQDDFTTDQEAAPDEKLERTTFHLRPSLVQAVRREADKTGVSYAAVLNNALATYFTGKG
jgi:predicted DNA binding CopG/RHH family protein